MSTLRGYRLHISSGYPVAALTAEILSQGDEVVTGQIADTNAAWLADRLTALGFEVRRHTAVGDRLSDLVAVLGELAGRCDLVVGTGGLGPTDDDLTAEAVAAAFDRPLASDPEALAQIEAMFARFNRPMAPVIAKQALLPAGARRLDNAWGTAPGFAVEAGAPRPTWFAFLPGVPREMKPMFEERVLPELLTRFALAPGRLVTLRTTGVGESDLQQRIGRFAHPSAVLGYRTMLPENLVKVRFDAAVSAEEITRVVAGLAARIGSPIFTVEGLPEALPDLDCGGGDLAEVIGRALVARGETLASAESCTGGRVAAMCTGVPGSSRWFLEGAVTYSNAAKERQVGVPAALIAAHGAVSEPVARALAEGVRAAAGATYGVSTTGIAGPDGGSPEKPVGTVHIAVATPTGTHHRLARLGGDRVRIQSLAAAGALDLLRRHLQGHLV